VKRQESVKIGRREVGPGRPCYIIFEVASTHENNWKIARNYVDQAKEVGADAVKFQLFEADKVLNPLTPGLKATYDYFKTAQTPRNWFPKLADLCKKAGIDLLCTPFDLCAASFLESVGLPAIKIASGELTNHQLLVHVAKFDKPVILSTGMATMREITAAVGILKNNGCSQLVILQCVSVYPMPYEDANVLAMRTLQEEFSCPVGYSDNGSKGYLVPLLAVTLGASVLEKHVTSQKRRGSMDDIFSLSVEEFALMVKKIRQLEKDYKNNLGGAIKDLKKEFGDDVRKALGNGIKKPGNFGVLREDGTRMLEADERQWARRGIYPVQLIRKGTKITGDMLISLRPDVGTSALSFDKILGAYAVEDLPSKHPILLKGKKVRRFRKSDIKKVYNKPNQKQFAEILTNTAKLN